MACANIWASFGESGEDGDMEVKYALLAPLCYLLRMQDAVEGGVSPPRCDRT